MNATLTNGLFRTTPGSSTDVNPLGICYSTPGTYDVTLIATGAGGSDTLTLTNYITVFPNPAPQGITQSGIHFLRMPGGILPIGIMEEHDSGCNRLFLPRNSSW